MSRRAARSQFESLRRGQIAKDKRKDYEKWLNQFATRRDVDAMIRAYLERYATEVEAARLAVEAELPVSEGAE